MQIPFDAILTLLVFLVGIPALILQLISVAERRAVIKKEGLDVQSFLRKALAIILIGLFCQFLFMFLLEKCKDVIRDFVEQFIWLCIFGALFYLVIKVSKQIPEQYGRREKIIEKLTQDTITESKRKGHIVAQDLRDR
jgi:ACR3 family arsenite efflux pump ArsB